VATLSAAKKDAAAEVEVEVVEEKQLPPQPQQKQQTLSLNKTGQQQATTRSPP
jgi:hypothetical protein